MSVLDPTGLYVAITLNHDGDDAYVLGDFLVVLNQLLTFDLKSKIEIKLPLLLL